MTITIALSLNHNHDPYQDCNISVFGEKQNDIHAYPLGFSILVSVDKKMILSPDKTVPT